MMMTEEVSHSKIRTNEYTKECNLMNYWITTQKTLPTVCTLILLVSAACTLFTCASKTSFPDGPVNSHGGIGRANTYSNVSMFIAQEEVNEKIPGEDSLMGAIVPPLVLSTYQTVVATASGAVSQSNSSRVEWNAKLDGDAFVCSGMCADAGRNIYCAASDGAIYSFANDGKRRFKTKYSDSANVLCTDILALSDGIVVADRTGLFTKLSLEGKLLWRWQSSLPTLQTFPADEAGAIYAVMTHNDYTSGDTLVKLSQEGKCEWKTPLPATRIIVAPIVGQGRIYVGAIEHGNSPQVVEFSPKGAIIRKISLRATPRGLSMSAGGMLYTVEYYAGLGETESVIQAFSAEGKEMWFLNFGCKFVSPALVSNDNIAIVGTKSMAIGVYLMRNDGVLDSFMSLETAPELLLKPAVSPDGTLIFAGSAGKVLTRVGRKKGLLPI